MHTQIHTSTCEYVPFRHPSISFIFLSFSFSCFTEIVIRSILFPNFFSSYFIESQSDSNTIKVRVSCLIFVAFTADVTLLHHRCLHNTHIFLVLLLLPRACVCVLFFHMWFSLQTKSIPKTIRQSHRIQVHQIYFQRQRLSTFFAMYDSRLLQLWFPSICVCRIL